MDRVLVDCDNCNYHLVIIGSNIYIGNSPHIVNSTVKYCMFRGYGIFMRDG